MNTPSLRNDLSHGLRAALQWRVWSLLIGFTLLPTALVALPLRGLLSSNFDYALPSADWAQNFSGGALVELVQLFAEQGAPLRIDLALALSLSLLLSPWVTGVLLHAIRTQPRAGFIDLLRGGLGYYARLLRLMGWALIPLLIAAGVFAALATWAQDVTENAVLASEGDRMDWVAIGIGGALFVLAHVLIETARAWLGTELARRGAGRALWRTLRLLLRRPIAVLGRYLLPTVGMALALALFAIARAQVPAIGWPALFAGFVLVQIGVIVTAFGRMWRLTMLSSLIRTHLSNPR